VVGQQNADTADTLQLRDVAMTTIFSFRIWGVHWRHLANTTELSVCGGDTALCQMTLTTCFITIKTMNVSVETSFNTSSHTAEYRAQLVIY